MSKFISYAQNFEDVLLWRALKEVECGFYIDVGANDPQTDSVTKAFYDRGWRGINLEPIEFWFERLEEARPRDINLRLAAGSVKGTLNLFNFPGTGLATSENEIAERHRKEMGMSPTDVSVPVDRLDSLCETFHAAPIHFLKIDVEGAERSVLEGMDFQRFRPWIILVESTLPNSSDSSHDEWEPIITEAGYAFVYFDGLNRFYVAEERSYLSARFSEPPNVFDQFVSFQFHEVQSRRNWLELAFKDLDQRHESLQQELVHQRDHAQSIALKLDDALQRAVELDLELKSVREAKRIADEMLVVIYASHSWRLSAPIRWFGLQLRHLKRMGEGSGLFDVDRWVKLGRALNRGSLGSLKSNIAGWLGFQLVLLKRHGFRSRVSDGFRRIMSGRRSSVSGPRWVDTVNTVLGSSATEVRKPQLSNHGKEILDRLNRRC